MNDNAILAAALSYAARGWRVIPLHSPVLAGCSCKSSECKHPGKHPRTRRWPKEASTDESVIRGWWGTWPGSNVGIVTGTASNLLVLDVDNKNGRRGNDTLSALMRAHGWKPETYSVITGSGRHLYFRHPGQPVSTKGCDLGEGLDVQADGRCVVAPPSRHPSGSLYTCESPESPIAAVPEWMISMLGKNTTAIPVGERNIRLARYAGTLRRQGKGQEQIREELAQINKARCEVPLADSEVEQIARSIARYPVGQLPYWWWFQFDMNTWAQSLAVRSGKDYHRGWAVELLYEAARHFGILPDDPDFLYQIARPSCSRKKFDSEIKLVLCDYRRTDLDGEKVLIHPGLVRWCEDRIQTSASRAEAGRKGGKARSKAADFSNSRRSQAIA